MHITLIYAGLLGLLFLLLSFWVVKRRAQFRVMIGEGEAPEMLAAIRAHGNFAEYVPLTLLLMALCELAGGGCTWAVCCCWWVASCMPSASRSPGLPTCRASSAPSSSGCRWGFSRCWAWCRGSRQAECHPATPPRHGVVFCGRQVKRFPRKPLSILTSKFNRATFRRGGLC